MTEQEARKYSNAHSAKFGMRAAFIWYRVGRHKAFVELYGHLTEVSQELGRVSQLLDAYRKKYAKELVEKEDGETE